MDKTFSVLTCTITMRTCFIADDKLKLNYEKKTAYFKNTATEQNIYYKNVSVIF